MRLGKWHRRLVLTALITVAVSGVLWFILHDMMERQSRELLHDLLVVHGAASFASAIALGSLLPWHVPVGYRQRRNLLSGLTLLLAVSVLLASALLLYYGGEESRADARLIHLVVGFAAIIIVPLHMVLGRRKSRMEWSSPSGK
jgi:drug/metabolite transporter (DMT)-like permease